MEPKAKMKRFVFLLIILRKTKLILVIFLTISPLLYLSYNVRDLNEATVGLLPELTDEVLKEWKQSTPALEDFEWARGRKGNEWMGHIEDDRSLAALADEQWPLLSSRPDCAWTLEEKRNFTLNWLNYRMARREHSHNLMESILAKVRGIAKLLTIVAEDVGEIGIDLVIEHGPERHSLVLFDHSCFGY